MVNVPNTPTPQAQPIDLGGLFALAGIYTTAISTWYEVDAARDRLKMMEDRVRHEQRMATLNRRMAEDAAAGILFAGEREVGRQTMMTGSQKAANRASVAARGVQLGSGGSVAEVEASGDIIAEIDRFNIEGNIERRVAAARMHGVNYANEALTRGVEAAGLAATRRSINPYLGAAGSLLSDASGLAQEWSYARRRT